MKEIIDIMTDKSNQTDNKFWQEFGEMRSNIANINERLTNIDKKLEQIDLHSLSVRIESNNNRANEREKRLKSLEDNQSKLVWAVILAILGAVLKLVIFTK